MAKDISFFTDFNLCKSTLSGLKKHKFEKPTAIQQQAIARALSGDDILGAAKTGSGKTIAFIVPLLECLHRHNWTKLDGLGALIISPTRELAYQTFQVLRSVGEYHDFSAGLVIGGKHVREESERLNSMNIIVCTPGRLLQHMDQTVNFVADNLQVLVLDEADRILDMGFSETLNAIIQNLPIERQTLLFSATQTRSVKDLARLSLKDPVYISVHENAQESTPSKLTQHYLICNLHDKIDILWGFIKHHLKQKTLVFIQSCKQVKFLNRVFCKLQPGVPILALHGDQNQQRRMDVYNQFYRKSHAVLLATDIASRGLDFPAVDWVVQFDCPDEASTYIHRVGRSARYEHDGEALLLLVESERPMLDRLASRKIPISEIKVDPKRQRTIQGKLGSLCAADTDLKGSSQRAFVSYIRSLFLMGDKEVFNIPALDLDKFATSMGLALTPRLRFLEKAKQNGKSVKEKKFDSQKAKIKSKKDGLFSFEEEVMKILGKETPTNTPDKSPVKEKRVESLDESSVDTKIKSEFDSNLGDNDDNDFLCIKRKHHALNDDDEQEASPSERRALEIDDEPNQLSPPPTKRKRKTKANANVVEAKRILRKGIAVNTRLKFDESGEPQLGPNQTLDWGGVGLDLDEAKQRMQLADIRDKAEHRERVRERHRQERFRLKKARRRKLQPTDDLGDEDSGAVVLGSPEDDEPEQIEFKKSGKKKSKPVFNKDTDDHQTDLGRTDECEFEDKHTQLLNKQKSKTGSQKRKSIKTLKVSELSLANSEQLALQLLSQ